MGLGERLRDIRRRRGMTTYDLAERAGVSRTYITQIENGRANPSVASLERLADALECPVRVLFDDRHDWGEAPVGPATPPTRTWPAAQVVRQDERKMVRWPKDRATTYLLTPNLQRALEVLLDEDVLGVDAPLVYSAHPGEECMIVLAGSYEVRVGDDAFTLNAGDSIYIDPSVPHAVRSIGAEAGRKIRVCTPPSF